MPFDQKSIDPLYWFDKIKINYAIFDYGHSNKAMSDEILTIKEVIEFLKVNERTVYRLAAAKKIPAFKVGNAWRFKKIEIGAWIAEQSSQGKDERDADN